MTRGHRDRVPGRRDLNARSQKPIIAFVFRDGETARRDNEPLSGKEPIMEPSEEKSGTFETQLRAWGAELDKLKAKVDTDVASAKTDYFEQVGKLRKEIEAQLLKWGYEVEELKSNAGPEARKTFQEMRAKVQAELKEWTPEIDMLKDKAAKAEAEAKKLLEELKAKQRSLTHQMGEFKGASSAALGDVMSGMGKAWDELKAGLHRAADKFK
jgi:chromosome segregation ATPase